MRGEEQIFSGREITGLEVTPERFSRLEAGRDYTIAKLNERVIGEKPVEDFFVFINPGQGEETKLVQPPHWRTITTEDIHNVLGVGDKKIDFYVANTKGVGYLKPTVQGKNLDRQKSWIKKDATGQQESGYKVLGLSSQKEYEGGDIIERSSQLAASGLRVEVYWAVAKLRQLPYKGNFLSIDELRAKNIIIKDPSYEPAMAVRLLKTNDRIEEAAKAHERGREIFERAFEVFNKETKDRSLSHPELIIGNKKHERTFFRIFFSRMGKNMAILLNLGLTDYYMHSSNVTMAAEIADIGSITHWKKDKDESLKQKYGGVRKGHLKDMRDMVYGLRILLNAGKTQNLSVGSREQLKKAFFKGFDALYNAKNVHEQEGDPVRTHEWMELIFDTVIIEKENLPSLQHYDIEDWSIEI